MRKWVLIDGNNVATRHFFGMPVAIHQNNRTEVIFGVLNSLLYYRSIFDTDNLVVCFDHGKSLRTEVLPTYKESRKQIQAIATNTPKDRKYLRRQIKKLKESILPELKIKNLLWENGYEADDIIASLCHYSLGEDEAIIVSNDKDFYQLLRGRVDIYNPMTERIITEESFTKEWGIRPSQWTTVKAIAGCTSDDIPGIRGVGDKTAIKWILKTLPKTHKAHISIRESIDLIERNVDLIKLPYKDCPEYVLEPDTFKDKTWRSVLASLGMSHVIKV